MGRCIASMWGKQWDQLMQKPVKVIYEMSLMFAKCKTQLVCKQDLQDKQMPFSSAGNKFCFMAGLLKVVKYKECQTCTFNFASLR